MTKRDLLMRAVFGLGLAIITLGGLVTAVIAFFLAARYTRRVWLLAAAAAAALVMTTGGGAWLLAGGMVGAGRLQAAGIAAAVALLGVGLLAYRFVFRPFPVPGDLPAARADRQFWQMPDGARIAYTCFKAVGERKQTPLIYLHGGPATPTRASYYDFFCQLTQDGYDVYLYDQAGTAGSSHLADISAYTLDRNVADLEAIRRQIGAEQIIPVGTSWGAVLAAHYLAAHPQRVACAAFLSPGVLGDRRGLRYDFSRTASSEDQSVLLPPLRFLFAGLLARINPAAAQNFASQPEMNALFDTFTTGPSLEYQSNCKGYRPEPGQVTRGRGGNYYANLMTLQSLRKAPDPRPKLKGCPLPALILRGECDYIPWESTRSYRDLLPNARLLIVPGAGHALIHARPDLVLAALRAFLTGSPLPLEPYMGDDLP